jgi:hypothetical protein
MIFGRSHCSIVQGSWSELEMLGQWAFRIYVTHLRWEWWLEGVSLRWRWLIWVVEDVIVGWR